jgi:hypothetical protein
MLLQLLALVYRGQGIVAAAAAVLKGPPMSGSTGSRPLYLITKDCQDWAA